METDLELQQTVLRYLEQGPDVDHGQIEVRVFNGVVTLSGLTRSDIEIWQIEDDIRAMAGVHNVVDRTMMEKHCSATATKF
jgi:osmotically-inducible protein OsmY